MEALISQILELRQAIRYHRDQIGDDRCWLDDYLVWNALPETKQVVRLPTYEEGMKKCRAFYENRNEGYREEIPSDAILDANRWDNDLVKNSHEDLTAKLVLLERAIRKHYDIHNRERTIEDDKELYSVLPEKIPADFRLPCEKDFLGTTKKDTGCPQFWKSHQHCPGEHNLHQWGPCRKS